MSGIPGAVRSTDDLEDGLGIEPTDLSHGLATPPPAAHGLLNLGSTGLSVDIPETPKARGDALSASTSVQCATARISPATRRGRAARSVIQSTIKAGRGFSWVPWLSETACGQSTVGDRVAIIRNGWSLTRRV